MFGHYRHSRWGLSFNSEFSSTKPGKHNSHRFTNPYSCNSLLSQSVVLTIVPAKLFNATIAAYIKFITQFRVIRLIAVQPIGCPKHAYCNTNYASNPQSHTNSPNDPR
jgi:hypothetical protein